MVRPRSLLPLRGSPKASTVTACVAAGLRCAPPRNLAERRYMYRLGPSQHVRRDVGRCGAAGPAVRAAAPRPRLHACASRRLGAWPSAPARWDCLGPPTHAGRPAPATYNGGRALRLRRPSYASMPPPCWTPRAGAAGLLNQANGGGAVALQGGALHVATQVSSASPALQPGEADVRHGGVPRCGDDAPSAASRCEARSASPLGRHGDVRARMRAGSALRA
jgi:hypothetical protein